MRDVAASGDTWGIPGPTFLLLFGGAAALILVVALVLRRTALAGDSTARPTDLNASDVAYLDGGANRAVYAALAKLRQRGALATTAGYRLMQAGPMPPDATGLEQAVYNAVGKRPKVREVFRDQWVRTAIDEVRTRLERLGLAVSASSRQAARLGAYLMAGLGVLGVVRIVAGVDNNRAVGYLVLATIAVFICAALLLLRVPRRSRAANRVLAELRGRYRHLRPGLRPSSTAYGAEGAGIAVALYGTGALWAMDPGFAAGSGITREPDSGNLGGDGGSAGGDSGGDGGGGGCGGGGCGGGCGG